MIAVKDTKTVSFFKLEPFIPTDSTNDFLLFDPFIASVFVQHVRTKAVTSHLFTPLFMFIPLPLSHYAPPPRLLIDFENSKWLPNFASYYALLCICYCFSHLIGLLSVTWLPLLYKFTWFFIYFLFLSDEGPMLETLHFTIRIGSTPTFLYFDLYLYSSCQQTTFITTIVFAWYKYIPGLRWRLQINIAKWQVQSWERKYWISMLDPK